MRRFGDIEAASGLTLVGASVLAVAWATVSPATYSAVLGPAVRWVIDDVLMSVFFFVVGLELRHELLRGQLRGARRAVLPLVAAAGGMIVPAVIYGVLAGSDAQRGWGIPMATDIAFALAVLALLGHRLRPGVRVLLLSLAIVDDLGSVLVLGVAYSHAIVPAGIARAVLAIAAVLVLQRLRADHWIWYAPPALVLWDGLYVAGIHPALAGVALGLLTPIPALEKRLHPFVAFGVMPLFALANAGVSLAGVNLAAHGDIVIAITVALIGGKLVGIVGATAVAVALGVARLPDGLRWRDVALVGLAAGIGFTMSLFVAELAFEDTPQYAAARLGVLVASTLAGLITHAFGRAIRTSGAQSACSGSSADPRSRSIVVASQRRDG
jgi:NhaA family Na+:H+ antiporter